MTSAPTIAAQPKNKTWHHQSAEDVLTQLGSSATGLSTQEAAQRLAADGCGWGVFVTYLMSGKFKETKCRLIGSCRDTPHIWGRFFGKSQKPPPYVASTTANPREPKCLHKKIIIP